MPELCEALPRASGNWNWTSDHFTASRVYELSVATGLGQGMGSHPYLFGMATSSAHRHVKLMGHRMS